MAKKSANQLYAEKHLSDLTTDWFDGYHHFVFTIKLKGETKFSNREEQVAWAEAAEFARKKLADLRERRAEVNTIKRLRAFLPSVNTCLSPKDKKSIARAIQRLEQGIATAGAGIR
jgi:hypothetical protein